MTMPPLTASAGGQPAVISRPCASSPSATACAQLSMGTSQDYVIAVEEGATIVRLGTI